MSKVRFLIKSPGPRPPFPEVAYHLWGRGADFDSDGNSITPGDRDWTELDIALRPAYTERVSVTPISEDPLVLEVSSESLQLARSAAEFLAKSTGASIEPADGANGDSGRA